MPFIEYFETLSAAEQRRITLHLSARDGGLPALLDSLPTLELFLPVQAHRRDWNGSATVIVGTMLHNGQAVGYASTGQAVELSSAGPPSDPVVALIPSEGPPPAQMYGAGSIGANTTSSGIYLVRSVIFDVGQYEHWLLGQPDIELHHFSGSPLEWTSCVGQGTGPFDQNHDEWLGFVRVAAVPEGPLGPGELPIHFQIWESDWGGCTYQNGMYSGAPRANASVASYLGSGAALLSTVRYLSAGSIWGVTMSIAAGIWFATSLNPDDFVGHLKPYRSDCWEQLQGPVRWRVIGQYEQQTGLAELDFVGVERVGVVCPKATIVGPHIVDSPTSTYRWDASNPSGGNGSYTYQWRRRFDRLGAPWEFVGTGSATLHMPLPTGESADFTIRVEVTSEGVTTNVDRYVKNLVEAPCPICPECIICPA